MYELTQAEQDSLRDDFKEKEKEIQRYIGVYLSTLVVVSGWIIGPQTKPLLVMALGNYGYNVYAFLVILIVNIIFTCFLIYKSLIIHEIMQFVTLTSKSESGLNYWEMWRRSSYSATRRVRSVYTVLIGLLPLMVSVFGIYILWSLFSEDPDNLLKTLKELKESDELPANPVTAAQLTYVFASAKVWFWIVVVLHILPLWFFYENVRPNNARWSIINLRKKSAKFEASLMEIFRSSLDDANGVETKEMVGGEQADSNKLEEKKNSK